MSVLMERYGDCTAGPIKVWTDALFLQFDYVNIVLFISRADSPMRAPLQKWSANSNTLLTRRLQLSTLLCTLARVERESVVDFRNYQIWFGAPSRLTPFSAHHMVHRLCLILSTLIMGKDSMTLKRESSWFQRESFVHSDVIMLVGGCCFQISQLIKGYKGLMKYLEMDSNMDLASYALTLISIWFPNWTWSV